MKKLQEPPSNLKTQTQIVETQVEEENLESIYLTQTGKVHRKPTQTIKPITQSEIGQKQIQTTTVIKTDEIGIQTDNSQNPSSIHECCQDVSTCPCVLVCLTTFFTLFLFINLFVF